MPNTQGGIDAFIDQVYRPVEQQELCRHRRKGVEKVVQDRTQHLLAAENGRCEGKSAARARPLACRQHIGLIETGQQASAGGSIALADFAQLVRACRAMEKLHADTALKEGHGAADSGRRASELATGTSKAALVERSYEHLHGVDAIHRLFLSGLTF